MESAANIIGIWKVLEGDALEIDEHRCVVVRNRRACCRRCAESCPAQCIHVEDGQIAVDAKKCIGCGTCAGVCPSAALQARRPSDAALREACQAAAGGGHTPVIACVQARRAADADESDRVIGVTCLGRLGASLLVTLLGEGSDIELRCASCASCPYGRGGAAARKAVEIANRIQERWGRPARVRRNVCDATCAPVDARGEAAGNAVPAPTTSDEAVVRVGDDGTLPHFVPERRRELLRCLREGARPAPGAVESPLWAAVAIDRERCLSCRMCTVFCPTGALGRVSEGDDGFFGLSHTPALCVNCGSCESLCPADALHLEAVVPVDAVLDGTTERIELDRPPYERMSPKSAMYAMRSLLGCGNIYDR